MKTLAAIVLAAAITGCTNVEYDGNLVNPQTGKKEHVSYEKTKAVNVKLDEDLTITRDDSTKIVFDTYWIDANKVSEIEVTTPHTKYTLEMCEYPKEERIIFQQSLNNYRVWIEHAKQVHEDSVRNAERARADSIKNFFRDALQR
ncbi:hypothetical protein C4573_03565 [Candidatus Woesearchaeota archaeon]|nr:MAG: hypothetical protein C4573_03565 [Candidatus Woesearchaeota archaeon]